MCEYAPLGTEDRFRAIHGMGFCDFPLLVPVHTAPAYNEL